MKAQLMVKPQVSLLLWQTEATVLINALKHHQSTDNAESEIINGIISELNKINEMEIKL